MTKTKRILGGLMVRVPPWFTSQLVTSSSALVSYSLCDTLEEELGPAATVFQRLYLLKNDETLTALPHALSVFHVPVFSQQLVPVVLVGTS